LAFVEKVDHGVWSEERFISPHVGLLKSIKRSVYSGTKTLEFTKVTPP
jgi:hypothetical protein